MDMRYRVKVPHTPLQQEVLARSKGVAGDCESERSWRQTFGPTDRNCI